MNKESILTYVSEAKRPLSYEMLETHFIKSEKDKKYLWVYLRDLVNEGLLIETRKQKFARPQDLNLHVGQIKKHIRGFGFFVCDETNETIFVPKTKLGDALDLDKVIVRKLKSMPLASRESTDHAEGEVIRILNRHKDRFVGTLERRGQKTLVRIDDKRVPFAVILETPLKTKIKNGTKVLVKVLVWPSQGKLAQGRLEKVLGHTKDIGMDISSIIYQNGLETDFSDETRAYLKKINKTITKQELANRVDYRHLDLITIDGSDSKDLDDAVYVEKMENGYHLSVHIADVGHYVHEGSPLDIDAFKRGTSVYLPDRVLPMLPELLSNDLCSLNPHTDKLALTCTMFINNYGEVLSHSIEESIINTSYRTTYEEINALLLEKDTKLIKKYQAIVPMLEAMRELQALLKKRRERFGSLDFDLPESKVILDDKGKPIDIVIRERKLSERMIEEFMICANETVAEHFYWLETPFLYRVHDKPDADKMALIQTIVTAEGLSFSYSPDDIKAKELQSLLAEIKESKLAYPLNMLLLRSMKHAHYSAHAEGHFGLRLKYYTHFTSPIRRYSDLAIHRVIKEHLSVGLSTNRLKYLAPLMEKYASQASKMELLAETTERQAVSLKKVQFMSDKVLEIFEARIVSVTGFGFFVQLDNLVEGLVHLSTLDDDFYDVIPEQMALVGKHGKKQYKVGDIVRVRLVRVDTSEVKLDFELVKDKQDENSRKQQKSIS